MGGRRNEEYVRSGSLEAEPVMGMLAQRIDGGSVFWRNLSRSEESKTGKERLIKNVKVNLQ